MTNIINGLASAFDFFFNKNYQMVESGLYIYRFNSIYNINVYIM